MPKSPRYWAHVVAVAFGVLIGLYTPACEQDNTPEANQMPPTESAMGAFPLPEVVGMNGCAGYVLASGPLDAAEHELNDGYAQVGGITLYANNPAHQTLWWRVRELNGRVVDVVLRPVPPRNPERLTR